MSRKIRLISFAGAAITAICSALGVYAEDMSINVVPDYTSYVINLSGFAGEEYSGKLVNIEILKPIGAGILDLPNVTAENFRDTVSLFSNTVVKEDGSFEYSFKLSESASVENPFWARVNIDAASAENSDIMLTKSFAYTPKQEIDAKLDAMKTSVNPKTLEADAKIMGIELPSVWAELDPNQRSYAANLISAKITAEPDTFSTEKLRVYAKDSIIMTSALAANDAAQLKEFLTSEEQVQYFGIDISNTYYTSLQSDNQQKVFERMKNAISASAQKADIARIFRESLLLESVKCASYKNSIAGIITEFSDVISSQNMADYAALSSSLSRLDYVYSTVINAADSQLTTVEAFNTMLSAAIKNSANISTQTPSTGGGGAGGGGGGTAGRPSGGTVMVEQFGPSQDNIKKEIFADISQHGWAKEAIEYLYKNDIINGKAKDKFLPDDYITREEAVKMICIAFDVEATTDKNYFSDVEGKWFEPYVNAAYEKEIISGIGENSFGAGLNITREDLLVIMARTLGITEEAKNDFSDASQISDYAKNAVSAMSSKGVVSGYPDGSFRPKNKMTRAEAAVAIYRLLKIKKEV